MTASRKKFTGSGERAATFAATFLCLDHPLSSAQTCLEQMQLPTPRQRLGARQGPDITSTNIVVTLGHIQLQHPHGFLSSAPPRHTIRPGQAQEPAQLPLYITYTPCRRPILIIQRRWSIAEPLPQSPAAHCVLFCMHPFAIPRTC